MRPIGHSSLCWVGVLALFLCAGATDAHADACAACGLGIRGDYLAMDNRSYCSQDCLATVLPQCDACNKNVGTSLIRSGARTYCSRKCFNTSLPTCELCGARSRISVNIGTHVYCREHGHAERCDSCRLPFIDGSRLNDGRRLCSTCEKTAVMSRDTAEKLFARAVRESTLVTGLASDTVPQLHLVGLDTLNGGERAKHSPDTLMYESGRYHRHSRKTTHKNLLGMTIRESERVTESISILYGLASDRFLATASHELTHDLLSEFYPRAVDAPHWVHEGVCQYVAAEVCRRNDLPQAVDRIATHEGPVYGNGYRYFLRRFGPRNWAGVDAFLRKTNLALLPETAPTDRASN